MKYRLIAFLAVTTSLFLSCSTAPIERMNTNLIPTPVSLQSSGEVSELREIRIHDDQKEVLSSLSDWLNQFVLPVSFDSENANCRILKERAMQAGTYDLQINKAEIIIKYSDHTSLRNALSSIMQLGFLNNGRLPQVNIQDKSGFFYRGMHLDVSRHFFSVTDIKKYIDYLCLYKFNYFHWHLTDDQGWRIEIKQFPKLQEISAYRDETLIGHYNDQPQKYDGQRYGGFYSQSDIKEVVAYAAARGIEVVPEIDIPGHSSALLAAYPELGCTEQETKTATKWGVFFDILCPKDATFEFLDKVFDEVVELFPSKYIHIGGDECPKKQWEENQLCQDLIRKEGLKDEFELQSYFIRRVEKMLNNKGKKIIGWDEILEGGLAPDATVMSWRGEQGGLEAARESHDVIMTPTSHCYFDYYQSENKDEPLAIGGFLPYEKIFNWDVYPKELETDKRKYVIGGQGNVWTEYIRDFESVEYMALARMITLAEVLWGKNEKSLDNFTQKLFEHTQQWEGANVNIANHLLDIKTEIQVQPGQGVYVKTNTPMSQAEMFYKSASQAESKPVGNAGVELREPGVYTFEASYEDSKGAVKEILYEPHLANTAQIELTHKPADRYSGNGPYSLINGVEGPSERYGGSEWLGFSGKDLIANLTFPNPTDISNIELKFFNGEGQWIYLPSEVNIYSINGERQELLYNQKDLTADDKILKINCPIEKTDVAVLLVEVKNYGRIPEGKQGAGHHAWLFVDEIKVR